MLAFIWKPSTQSRITKFQTPGQLQLKRATKSIRTVIYSSKVFQCLRLDLGLSVMARLPPSCCYTAFQVQSLHLSIASLLMGKAAFHLVDNNVPQDLQRKCSLSDLRSLKSTGIYLNLLNKLCTVKMWSF